ncbi:hypothetical protein B0H67DRAFT_498094 [Lasiosphaeris hirsuta]|uniref:BSD domain-containing protein n=1 Tax=Lasiosphaeris hirsuta TaxID=260670 RepID=A0AA39ZX15_9PEZI|nr:hypothetical protein B0H67DRAFT_498094 [Lasiosphaeris hirsuta]
METPQGKAAYKKKDGIITLTEDQTSLIWTPLPGSGPPVVSLLVDSINNLQQTPDTSAKVMLKVIEKPREEGTAPAAFLFHFTSPTEARPEANALKALLSKLITEKRGIDPPKLADVDAPANGTAASAAMSFANAINAKPMAVRWFDDNMLKGDIALQESLLEKDKDLKQTYIDALATKPESLSDMSFNTHFWATRINLLRSHAIQLNQKKGSYNVLSTIKPRVENDELKLNLNVEQVQLIFQQHPLVKRIYNENVPKLSEGQFWSQFFLSRLYKKLRGERVADHDDTNPIFDKYNETDPALGIPRSFALPQIPHIIDIEANEENQGGFKSGNRKDVEMRPRANIPIVKTLNSLSEKIMQNVAPTDQELSSAAANEGADLDASNFEELTLHDLRGDAAQNRIILNVKERSKFFSNQSSAESTEETLVYERQVPSEVLFEIQADLETLDDDGYGGIDLHKSIGVDDDSDSDVGGVHKQIHVGSRGARRGAQDQILDSMAKKRTGGQHLKSDDDDASIMSSPMGIPPDVAQRCYLTNATTAEFLKQFWGAFLSGDPARTQELAYHAESLQRSIARIDALAAEAEKLHDDLANRRKREIRDHYKKTGKKTKWIPIGGGKEAVLALFEATLTSLHTAQSLYRAAAN